MTTIICAIIIAAAAVAAVVTYFILRRSERELSQGELLLLSGIFTVIITATTFFLCFSVDAGIIAVPIVLIAVFAVLYIIYCRANSVTPDGTKRAKRSHRITLGSNTKKAKRFLLSSGSVALGIAAVILVNLIFGNLNDRFDWNIDLTESGMYSISDDTDKVLNELSDEVDITVLLSEDELAENSYGSYVQTLMKKYAERSDKIKISYIDPYKNPSAVESYSDLADDVSEGSIIVQSGDSSKVLNLIDFYETETDSSTYSYYVSAFKGEGTLTSAILSVTSENTPSAYILQGHNESVSTSFTDMLETSGYTVDTLNLTEKDIPDNTSMLVISLPQDDYTEDELNTLDDFVKNGGDLLVFTGTDSPSGLDNLYAYLQEWGITVNGDMVRDSDYNISDARYILSSISDTDYTSALDSKSDQVIVTPNARSLTVGLDSDVSDRTVETILTSRDTSYARTTEDGATYDSYDKESSDTDGPFDLAAVASYTGNESGGQVLVCSSALMMTDQLMESTTLLNKDFLSAAISEMQPDVELVSIDSKSMSAEPLTLSSTATYVVFVFLVFIPLFLFVYGILVFLHRRKL